LQLSSQIEAITANNVESVLSEVYGAACLREVVFRFKNAKPRRSPTGTSKKRAYISKSDSAFFLLKGLLDVACHESDKRSWI
jgi:hypothetical protein